MTFIIGTPHTRGAGYLGAETGGHRSKKVEADIQTCSHCQAAISMQAWKDSGGWCSRCQKPVCAPCADAMLKHGCLPYLARLEQILETDEQRAQLRKLLGTDGGPGVPSLNLNV